MIGPLPRLHGWLVVVTVVVATVVAGAWITHATVIPVDPAAGASVGLVVGGLLAAAVLHGQGSHQQSSRSRQRRR